MPVVYVASANRAQLYYIATTELGLAVSETATAGEIRELIRQSGNSQKSFEIDVTTVVGVAPQRRATSEKSYKRVRLTIQPGDGEFGTQPIWLAVNGRGMWVPRGEPVIIPRHLFEGSLEQALEVIFPETGNPRNPEDPILGNPISRPRFNYTVHEFLTDDANAA